MHRSLALVLVTVAVLSPAWVAPPAAVAQDQRAPDIEIPESYSLRQDIEYSRAGGTSLTLDLYAPKEADGPLPVLVYYHGGGWIGGDRHSSARSLLPYIERGFAVVNVTYRLGHQARAPAAVVDALCALRWVARHATELNLDAERIVVSGHSAGGHLALIVAMLPADSPFANECASWPEIRENELETVRPAAVINWFGITDVADLLVEPHRQLYAQQWIGGQLDAEEIAHSVSPLTHVRPELPAILTIHGDLDTVVPYEHATRLHEALDEAGNVNELITMPDGGHGGFPDDQAADAYARIWKFLGENGVVPVKVREEP